LTPRRLASILLPIPTDSILEPRQDFMSANPGQAAKSSSTPSKRTPFPRVFWVANFIEILERFAYYGIYFGFGIYMEHLGFKRGDLGVVQSLFLFVSYCIPVFSGTFADRFGFKKLLIVS
jgi:dipeptide/tripeptide permease